MSARRRAFPFRAVAESIPRQPSGGLTMEPRGEPEQSFGDCLMKCDCERLQRAFAADDEEELEAVMQRSCELWVDEALSQTASRKHEFSTHQLAVGTCGPTELLM